MTSRWCRMRRELGREAPRSRYRTGPGRGQLGVVQHRCASKTIAEMRDQARAASDLAIGGQVHVAPPIWIWARKA